MEKKPSFLDPNCGMEKYQVGKMSKSKAVQRMELYMKKASLYLVLKSTTTFLYTQLPLQATVSYIASYFDQSEFSENYPTTK